MGKPSQFRAGEWEPKFPDFALGREGPLGDSPDDTGAEPWTPAPASSHLSRFRLWDARKYKFLRALLGGVSQLNVVFKANGRSPETQYTYEFRDHDQARRVYDAMAAAEHPGEVVHAMLIKEGVPYTKDAGKAF